MVDRWNQRRREVAARYQSEFTELPLTFQRPSDEHVYHLFQIRTENRQVRDSLLGHLQSRGIDAVVRYPVPLHLQPAFHDLGYRAGRFPTAEALATQTLCLPIRPDLTENEISYVCDTVTEFFGRL
jgi:dTDP-4-amino-4,6-dideoxygalactose transaminase